MIAAREAPAKGAKAAQDAARDAARAAEVAATARTAAEQTTKKAEELLALVQRAASRAEKSQTL